MSTITGVLDGRSITITNATITPDDAGKAAATDATKPYLSEHGEAMKGAWKTDAQNRLLDGNTGEVLTQPESTDPLPDSFGSGTIEQQIQVLRQWIQEHSYFKRGFVIDGTPFDFGYLSGKPVITLMTAGGKLQLDPNAPKPVMPVVTPLPASENKAMHIIVPWPAAGQVLLRSKGLAGQPLVVTLQVPADWKGDSSHTGFFSIVEVPGNDVVGRKVVALVNDAAQYTSEVRTSVSVNYTVGGSVGQINPQPGQTMTYVVTNNGGVLSDVLIDIGTPERY